MGKLKFEIEKPRIVLMVNDIVGLEVMKFLLERQENVVALFLHDTPNQKMVSEILDLGIWKISSDDTYTAATLKSEYVVEILTSYKPDVIITCYWAHLLQKEVIEIPKYGCINFHPALLPKNRGWYPSVWPFLDKSPAGVTLHLIDEGADTGPIIAQREIEIEELDNAGTVYKKSQDAMIALFKDTWVKLFEGIELQYQDHASATYHSKKEANTLDELKLTEVMTAGEFLGYFKAKTFGHRSYSYYKKGDDTYRVHLTITKE